MAPLLYFAAAVPSDHASLGRTVRSFGRQCQVDEVSRGGLSDAGRVAHGGVVLAVPGQQGGVAKDSGEGNGARVRVAASWMVPTTSNRL